jgi:hypothetical protein
VRRKRSKAASDEWLLARGESIEWLLPEAARREMRTQQLSRQVVELAPVGRQIMVGEGKESLRDGQGDGRKAW